MSKRKSKTIETAGSNRIRNFLLYIRSNRNLALNTVESYRLDLEDFAQYAAKNKTAASLAPELLNRNLLRSYVYELKFKKNLAPSTVARRVSALRSFIKYLSRMNRAKASGGEALGTGLSSLLVFGKGAKRKKILPKALTREDVLSLLSTCKLPRNAGKDKIFFACRDKAIIETLYSCGVRVSELCDLQVHSFYRDAGIIRVIGKGSKERMVPVGSVAMRALEDCLNLRKLYLSRHRLTDPPYLFLNRFGKRLSRVWVEKMLKAAGRTVGVQVTPHKLRHSFATHLLLAGLDLRSLQEMLGHKSLEATEIYTKLTVEDLRSAYNKLHPRA
ncbi:tyrosine-type recombinase/integrase [Elusimicrobiota bacterium]